MLTALSTFLYFKRWILDFAATKIFCLYSVISIHESCWAFGVDLVLNQVSAFPMEEEQAHCQDNKNITVQSHPVPPPLPETNNIGNFHVMPAFPMTTSPVVLPVPIESPTKNLSLGQSKGATNLAANLIRPIPALPSPHASGISDLYLNLKSSEDPSSLSLKLSLPCDERESSSMQSVFQVMSGFNNGDSMISVAWGRIIRLKGGGCIIRWRYGLEKIKSKLDDWISNPLMYRPEKNCHLIYCWFMVLS